MKRVLITGASSGIGEATVRLFSQKGYETLLLARNENRLKKLSSSLPSPSSVFSLDLLDEKAILEFTSSQKKPIDILINNAGTFHVSSFETTDALVWKKQFQIHVLAPVLFLKYLKVKESVVNVGSTCALSTVYHTSAYSAMKQALVALTEHLALEWGRSGVRVNCICPGIVDTPIHSFHNHSEEQKKTLHRLHPLGRMGKPSEVAKAIYFLAVMSWMTGSVLPLDGGIRLNSNQPVK